MPKKSYKIWAKYKKTNEQKICWSMTRTIEHFYTFCILCVRFHPFSCVTQFGLNLSGFYYCIYGNVFWGNYKLTEWWVYWIQAEENYKKNFKLIWADFKEWWHVFEICDGRSFMLAKVNYFSATSYVRPNIILSLKL